MTKCAPLWRLLLSLFLAFSIAGCSQFKRADVADEKDPHFLDAKRRQGMKDTNGAIQSFERALQSNPRNATAHLELGLIYEARPTNQASAIYHFEKYLNLRTNSQQTTVISEKIAYAKRSLATMHAPTYVNRSVQAELEKLLTANQNYARRIEQLEAESARVPRYITNYVTNWYALDETKQRSQSMAWQTKVVDPPPSVVKAEVGSSDDEEPVPAPRTETKAQRTASTETKTASGTRSTPPSTGSSGSRTQRNTPPAASTRRTEPEPSPSRARTVHTVRPGDTLVKVAQRYGVSVADLRKANPAASKGTVSGQKLVIPEK
ncbi:MAG TPA: LysM peptidoglycan-binding domain-containing protein [Verrucomicrobiae bacterium]